MLRLTFFNFTNMPLQSTRAALSTWALWVLKLVRINDLKGI